MLRASDEIYASELTFLEAHRAVARIEAASAPEGVVAALRQKLSHLAQVWWVVPMQGEVVQRAQQPFDREPVRSLDAIHLATALLIASTHGEPIVMLTTDDRVRVNASLHGLELKP